MNAAAPRGGSVGPRAAPAQTLILARDVCRVYGEGAATHAAVDRVSFDVQRHDISLIFGPSGSGKSTLLSIVGGLDRDYTGSVELFGSELRELTDKDVSRLRAEHVGFVFQSFQLLSHLSVLGNVTTPALFAVDSDASRDERGIRARGLEVLERVGLADRATARPGELSGGQRQRVAIARALFNEPELLLCDEPTGNLDQETGEQVIDLFQELHESSQVTFVIVTHEERLLRIGSRRMDMIDGRLTEIDPNNANENKSEDST
jgi:putative ABC transport system ATP-binding protein